MPIIFNSYALFSIMLSDFTQIGSFNEDILSQGVSSLLPLSIFILILGFNAALIYINIHKPSEIWLHKLAAYIFVVIAVEICVSIYSFYVVGGIESIRWCFGIFHLAFIVLSIWSYRRFNANKIYLRITAPHLLLILVSVGVFTMVYVPHGLYNLYGDSSVILGNTLSITSRESLQPYFTADSFYSPIMGFISVLFVAITGCNNLLLACNLPFLLGALLLPFVTYHFLRSFVTDDPRIAVLGALVVALMDGLAVILLPIYNSNITVSTIQWYISGPTSSLYSTNIGQLWLTPFKNFAAVSAIAACSMLDKRRVINYVLAGGIFFISFMNPRYSLLSLILLVFLFGIRKIDLRGTLIFASSVILFSGFTFPVHLYKQLLALSVAIANQGLVHESFSCFFNNSISSLVLQDNYTFVGLIVIMSLLVILFLSLFGNFTKTNGALFTSYFFQRIFPTFSVKIGKSKKKLIFSSASVLLYVSLMCIFVYAFLHTYYPDILAIFTSTKYLSTLNSMVLRYHVLIGFFIVGLLTLKFPRRIALTIIAILLIFYFGGRITGSINILPLVFVILAMPFIDLCIKYKRKLAIISLLTFVFFGIFSATFYSATVTNTSNTEYSELPDLLARLLEEGEVSGHVYSPSSYKYYVDRIVKQSHMRLSSDSNCSLYIIDTKYMNATVLVSLLNDLQFTQKYVGERFILLERR
ncbi:MAG: hypothetical protein IAX22_07500 [Candidatus Bathyarchaeota archaeon]|nr:hypothetical protein [Candidatus Bathyarchaeota archaeon]